MRLYELDHPTYLAWTSQFNMDFEGHNTLEHDFALPPAQTNVNPQSTRPSGTIKPVAFTKGTGRGQELASRPSNPPRRLISPNNGRSLGAS